ncbi:hypothetical protein EG329_006083 [Mollisiaceae sp. DMI_Dod_QoI]|nr:hypothetical protein EG329_006083 [Helotiales sp. DMI_Dod_QoI]
MSQRGLRSNTAAAAQAEQPSSSSTTQPERETTLQEKHDAALRRIAELEAQIRLEEETRELYTQINRLEQRSIRRESDATPATTQLLSRAPKTRELPAELKWREDQDRTWVTDASKITHCVSCFKGIPRDIWRRRERRTGVDNTTWEKFQEFMKDSITDTENRSLGAITKYNNAMQRPGQSVQAFVSYLESLEDDLGYIDDKTSRNFLLAKLRPEIREDITHHGQIPPTRERLVAAAVHVENHQKLFRVRENPERVAGDKDGTRQGKRDRKGKAVDRERSRSPRRESPIPQRPSYASSANATPVEQRRDLSSIRCHKCQKMGHYATTCPELKCYNCNQVGHRAWSCPQPKRSGNDRAS